MVRYKLPTFIIISAAHYNHTKHYIGNPDPYHCLIPKTVRYKNSFMIHHLLRLEH